MPDPDDSWSAAVELFVLAEIEIDHLLRAAKGDYDRARGPSEKRLALGGLIVALMALLNLHEPWRRAKIAAPLRDLITSFLSLDAGAVEPLLSASKSRGRPALQSWTLVRAYAAAAAATLMGGGKSEDDADGWVADCLQVAGYKKPRKSGAREDGRSITSQTIRAWRKEAREAPAGHVVRSTYEWLIAEPGRRWLTEPPFDPDDEPTKKAQKIISVLVQLSPPEKM